MAITELTYNQFPTRPKCKAYRSAALSVASGSSGFSVPLDATYYDSFSMYDAVNDRISITVPGIYLVVARMSFATTGSTGHRSVGIAINGVDSYRHPLITPRAATTMNVHTVAVHEFAVSDYITLEGVQTEGINLNLTVGSPHATALDVTWLRGPS